MASPSVEPAPGQRRVRARKSIAHLPSQDAGADVENTEPLQFAQNATAKRVAASKKSRSKSLGPGGLDALQETSGNRRRSAALAPPPRSILKPTIPLSPLRDIPIRKPQNENNAPASPTRGPAHSAASYDQLLEAAIAQEEAKINAKGPTVQPQASDAAAQPNGSSQDGEAEERRRRKAEIQKQREARRKSMANRRVSFAPEATLHTWDTEVLQESTTSTGSGDATRRASSFSRSQSSTTGTDRPKTPPEQTEDPQVAQSPEHQRDAHQKKRRRSSGIPPMNFNDPDALSSSPYSGSSAIDEDDDTVTSQRSSGAEETPSEDADGTLGEATMQSLEGDNTATSQKMSPDDDDVDNSLQDAAERAGTRTIEYDENGDVSMEIVGDEVTGAFKPWLKRGTVAASPHPGRSGPPHANQENINPFSPVAKQIAGTNGSPTPSSVGDDMSMDMTHAVGGIVPSGSQKAPSGRKSMARRQSVAFRRQSSGALAEMSDSTTDLALGSGKGPDAEQQDENEDLSMEFTSIFGGLSQAPHTKSRRQSLARTTTSGGEKGEADGDMEMTEAVGAIFPSVQDRVGEEADDSQSMDFTTAVGQVKSPKREQSQSQAPLDDGHAAFATSGLRRTPVARPPQPVLATSTAGSPSVVPRPHRAGLQNTGLASVEASATPDRRPQTPSHQMTPQPPKPSTPSKTPPSSSVSMRKSSPKRLFEQEIQESTSPAPVATPSIFRKNGVNGQQTPSVVLAAPKSGPRRRISGLGVDKEGLGSPKMAAILDRRASLGEQGESFASQGVSRGVRFDDPKEMAAQLTREREEDQRRESGQYIMEQEADQGSDDDRDATANLKELMQSMSPKKNKFKGRKSLAVGSAKGVLGKRPAELDNDIPDDEGSPRTFGSASSPVKKIRLQGPPSASDTIGKGEQGLRKTLAATSANARPSTPSTTTSPSVKPASTPKSHGKYKDADAFASAQKPKPVLGQTTPMQAESAAQDDGEDKLGLQDFLNLTNIRFMELTTTKRRPTMAAKTLNRTEGEEGEEEDPKKLFEDSVVAGACTLPMLELFQHSCRELKKYISEGRSIIREIELATLEENPPVFREYLSASPADRTVMDNQFKNMKANARLLSKATWYEWRMKLLEGIKESLRDTGRGFEEDDRVLKQKEDALRPLFPAVLEEYAALERESVNLQRRAEELAACDPEDLEAARERLQSVSEELGQKAGSLEEHQLALQHMEREERAAQDARQAAQAETKEAQRIREDCRGWSLAEVHAIQSRVDKLVTSSGWNIVAANGTSLTLGYKSQLELCFNSAAFLPAAAPNASTGLSLAYTGRSKDAQPEQPSTVTRFFLQLLRAQLHSLAPAATPASALLKLVSSGWACACAVERYMEQLRLRIGPTSARIVGDEKLAVETDILLPGVQSKIAVAFELHASARGVEVGAAVRAAARVVYGEEYREDRMSDFVRKRIGATLQGGHEAEWAEAVGELRRGLVRRGPKS